MSSRIEQCMDEIETFIDNCKTSPLNRNNLIVNREEIEELLRELRSKTPDEIKRYQQIISNKEAILNDAKRKAQDLIDKATAQTNELINEHEIMQQAYAQANEVIAQAAKQAEEILTKSTNEANQMKAAAVAYTDQLLADVDEIISKAIETTNANNSSLINSLTDYSETIRSNRADLVPPSVQTENTAPVQVDEPVAAAAEVPAGDDLNLDML